MFSEKRKVRLSDCDSNGCLSEVSLMGYFQDLSEECDYYYGVGTIASREKGHCFVVLSWDVAIYKRIYLNEELQINIYNNKYNGLFAIKSWEAFDINGFLVATATVNLGICDVNTMKLTQGSKDYRLAVPADEYESMPRLTMSNSLEKNSFTFSRKIRVSKAFTDLNGHVNNVKYLYLIDVEMPTEHSVKRMQLYYYKAALANEELLVEYCDREDGRIIRLLSAETGDTKFLAYFHTVED